MKFNMTPLIDIVFLLIIFFVVVSQFIDAENFPVTVPDDCEFAQDSSETPHAATLTVLRTDAGTIEFALGAEKINTSNPTKLIDKLADLIDTRFQKLPTDQRIVTLRIDKDVCYSHAQYALAAIAASTATDIKLAALKDKRPAPK